MTAGCNRAHPDRPRPRSPSLARVATAGQVRVIVPTEPGGGTWGRGDVGTWGRGHVGTGYDIGPRFGRGLARPRASPHWLPSAVRRPTGLPVSVVTLDAICHRASGGPVCERRRIGCHLPCAIRRQPATPVVTLDAIHHPAADGAVCEHCHIGCHLRCAIRRGCP
jgi:hypothetical protein